MSYRSGGLRLNRQQAIPVIHENIRMDLGFRADLIVESMVVVEIKSVEAIVPVHKKQLLTYLRLTDKKLGLLVNFKEWNFESGEWFVKFILTQRRKGAKND